MLYDDRVLPFLTYFFIIFDVTDSIDNPAVLFSSLPGFGIGVILANFHSYGTCPVESEILTSFESGSTMLQAVCFCILAWVTNRSYTDSSVESSCLGQSLDGRFISNASGNSIMDVTL